MKYIELNGDDIGSDAKKIEREMEADENIVFIYTNDKTTLYAYIDRLNQEGELPDRNQLKLKICYERKGLDLTWRRQGESGREEQNIMTMSQLIKQLDDGGCQVIVNDDKRSTLAEVVQQLIYIGYPLTKMEIMLKKEAKDYERAEHFMKNIDILDRQMEEALAELREIRLDDNDEAYEENKKRLVEVAEICQKIKEQIQKAKNRNLKIAVVATKKAGKSVIVNSMIGEELAPTSLELATPNTCVYTKSKDGSYHLDYNGKSDSFDSVKDIHKKIDEEFKRAQEATSEGFSIHNMDIGYVSEKNNFDAYTIYDTPGPDAAGTTHSQRAWETIKQCDVAIFAIDYTKYLTDSEEKYLNEIKKQFNEQMKFDSLIFTINKIDSRYQDVGVSKSIIKSIDFIRKRLRDIDKAYSDCAIFATSALQYFNILEAEKVCGAELRESKDLYEDLRPLKKKYKEVKTQLSFLDAQAGFMESESGLENITLDDLRRYSGMPDLLEYVAYIAKTKARNELVNSVAYKIDVNQEKIRGIISWIENLKKLINKNDEEIEKITQIFQELEEGIKKILTDEIMEADIREVREKQKRGKTSCLRIYQEDFGKRGRTFSFQEIMETEKRRIKEAFDSYDSASNDNNAYTLFYRKLKNSYWEAFNNAQMEKKILFKEDNWLVNGMISDIVAEIRRLIIDREFQKEAAGTMVGLNDECNDVLNNRMQWLRKEIETCKQKLNKINCNYTMPKIPSFDVASSELPELEKLKVKEEDLHGVLTKLDVLYRKTNIFEDIVAIFKDSNYLNKEGRRKTKKISKEEFADIFKKMENDIKDIAKKIELIEHIKKDGAQMSDNICGHISCIKKQFRETNEEFAMSIGEFTRVVDERKKYKDDKKRLEGEEEFIVQISGIMTEFLDSWERIANPPEELDDVV